jgi:hypothetical protein
MVQGFSYKIILSQVIKELPAFFLKTHYPVHKNVSLDPMILS